MPPPSYVITAVVLGLLVAASIPPTFGFAIILWRWLFLVAAFVLVTVGAIRIAYGLHVSPWIGVALAAPALVWAAQILLYLKGHMVLPLHGAIGVMSSLAFLISAVCALRLAEMMSRPHAAFLIGYGVLGVYALLVLAEIVASASVWNFTTSAPYVTVSRATIIAVALVKYGAIIGAAVLITMQRGVESWAAAVIGLVSAYMIYSTIWPVQVAAYAGAVMFWVQPVILLIGAAAVWRMGSVLHAQARHESYVRG